MMLAALQGFELPPIEYPFLGTRAIVGIVMLLHMFFATLFVGYAVGSPLLMAWGKRTGNEQMKRLARSLAHFNILTFSVGATWAVMFLVLIVGLYPRVTAALFIHFFWFFPVLAMGAMVLTLWLFYVHYYRGPEHNVLAGVAAALFILLWQSILSGMDSFMVTGTAAAEAVNAGNVSAPAAALGSIFNPMFIPVDLHRTFGNLSWPAFAVAAWAAYSHRRAKKAEDREYYDWAGSMGVIFGTLFLLFQPIAGFTVAYAMKLSGPGEAPGGAYERLTSGESSNLLYINLLMVVTLFVLSNAAMYLGVVRDPERRGRQAVRFSGLAAAVAGLYSVSPLAEFPFLYARYIALLVMVFATLGALTAYVRSRRRFSYGRPGGRYRAILVSLGVLAAVLTLNMGFMKSNSRAPYTIYGQPDYRVESEQPVVPEQLAPGRE